MSNLTEGQPSYPPAVPAPQTSTMAIVSLVTGILGWFALPLIGGIIAVVCGTIARKEIKNSRGLFTGDGMAIAGIVLGSINIAMVALFLCCWLGSVFLFLLPLGNILQ